MPRVGSLVDTAGSRTAMAMVGGLFGVVLAASAGIVGLVTLTIGFTAVRLLGQGALSLVSTTAIAPWFKRRRGLAIGVTTAVGSSLISLVPIGSAALIRAVGWRSTWLILAAVVWLVLIPIALRGIVNDPAVLGQSPDGDAPAATDSTTPARIGKPRRDSRRHAVDRRRLERRRAGDRVRRA